MSGRPKKVRADQILHALSKRHEKDVWLTEVKTGPTWTAHRGELKRIDGIAIKPSWSSPCITAYEVKVDRQDFLRDEKWPAYRQFCHRLYFACPKELIHPDELPEDVGLVTYNPENGNLHTAKAARFRDIEIPVTLLYHIVISRTDRDRHPFFSDRRKLFEAYVEDKKDKKELGYLVRTKLVQQLREETDRAAKVERELESLRMQLKQLDELKSILREFAIEIRPWGNWQDDLRQRLRSGISMDVVYEVNRLLDKATKIRDMVGGKSR
jgi:hypothetical protein